MEIGERCPTALDLAYRDYAEFVVRTYNVEPAPLNVWIRVSRGVSNRSQAKTGIRLQSATEHRQWQHARAALSES